MVVVLEEMGRVPLPGPFFSSAVFATLAARRLGLDDLLASLAAGATRGTVALDEVGHGDPVDRIRTRASRKAGRWRLDAARSPSCSTAHTADWVLVAARTQQGIGTFLVEAPGGEPVPAWLDVTRKVARLDARRPPGRAGRPRRRPHRGLAARRRRRRGRAVRRARSASMQQAFDLAVEYAKVRVQFDRPIATFQAIKHKAADMLARASSCRGSARTTRRGRPTSTTRCGPRRRRWPRRSSAEAANDVCGECIQIHGGVGFTWDCDAHLSTAGPSRTTCSSATTAGTARSPTRSSPPPDAPFPGLGPADAA